MTRQALISTYVPEVRGELVFAFYGRTTPDPTKTRPSNVTDTRGVPFFVLYASAPRPPLPVIPSDARRNACLQERAVKSAHEPHRGEVSEARNPPAHYPLRGDPSTSLRSVFGMTYEADGRFPPVSPAIEKSRRRDCRARAALTITTLPPRFARHPPLHREGKKYKIPLATSRKNAQHFYGTFARGQE